MAMPAPAAVTAAIAVETPITGRPPHKLAFVREGPRAASSEASSIPSSSHEKCACKPIQRCAWSYNDSNSGPSSRANRTSSALHRLPSSRPAVAAVPPGAMEGYFDLVDRFQRCRKGKG
jgi:hypothetical protein